MSQQHSDPEQELDQLLAEYMRRIDAGDALSIEQWVTQHPRYADQLREVLEAAELVEQLAGPCLDSTDNLDTFGESPTLPPSGFQEATTTFGGKPSPSLDIDPADLTPCKFGDYELLEVIGRGGMGVVYKARQVKMDRLVAVKMIISGQLATADDVQRFYREARAAGKIEHPNIITIYEVNQLDGHHFFSMDYVEGSDLARLLREGEIDTLEATRYLRDVARAIEAAHEKGFLHRDMKPANILIDESDRVIVTDFGLAKRIDQQGGLTTTGTTMGTPNYMPPEQALGDIKNIGPATDVYSMGAILFVILTGRTPFRSESVAQTIFDVVHTPPPLPRSLNPQANVNLETICLKCLEKSPEQRYATAGELADELTRVLNNEPILAKPQGRLKRSWNWLTSVPLIAALAGRHVVRPTTAHVNVQRGFLLALLLVPLVVWLALMYRAHQKSALPSQIRIATSSETGLYYEVGSEIARRLGDSTNRESTALTTQGSLDNIERLRQGEVELALIQIDALNDPNVAVVMPLYHEVVHVILPIDAKVESIDQLKGKRIAIGTVQSGTHVTSLQVLGYYGIDSENSELLDIDFSAIETDASLNAAIATTLTENQVLQSLLRSGRFRILPLQDTEQIALENVSLKPYRIFLEPEQQAGIATVATAAVLAARRDAPDKLIQLALKRAYADPLLHKKLIPLQQASLWQGLDLHAESHRFYANTAQRPAQDE